MNSRNHAIVDHLQRMEGELEQTKANVASLRRLLEAPQTTNPTVELRSLPPTPSIAGHGSKLLSELGFGFGKRRIGRQIEVSLGAPRRTEGVTLVPVGWRAASAAGLFPTLDGQLEIAKLGVQTTQLAFSASYDPPLGLVGKAADRALLHRVAEVTIKDFMERIGDRLEHTD